MSVPISSDTLRSTATCYVNTCINMSTLISSICCIIKNSSTCDVSAAAEKNNFILTPILKEWSDIMVTNMGNAIGQPSSIFNQDYMGLFRRGLVHS